MEGDREPFDPADPMNTRRYSTPELEAQVYAYAQKTVREFRAFAQEMQTRAVVNREFSERALLTPLERFARQVEALKAQGVVFPERMPSEEHGHGR